MLEDAAGIRRVVLACGTVDLRKGIDGLAMMIGDKYNQNPFEKGTLFLFCGKRSDRCKGLLWMGSVTDGQLVVTGVTKVSPEGGSIIDVAPQSDIVATATFAIRLFRSP